LIGNVRRAVKVAGVPPYSSPRTTPSGGLVLQITPQSFRSSFCSFRPAGPRSFSAYQETFPLSDEATTLRVLTSPYVSPDGASKLDSFITPPLTLLSIPDLFDSVSRLTPRLFPSPESWLGRGWFPPFSPLSAEL